MRTVSLSTTGKTPGAHLHHCQRSYSLKHIDRRGVNYQIISPACSVTLVISQSTSTCCLPTPFPNIDREALRWFVGLTASRTE